MKSSTMKLFSCELSLLYILLRGALNSAAEASIPIEIGKPILLNCHEAKSTVEWIKDSEEDNILKSDTKYTVFERNSTLRIGNADPDDAGNYECRSQTTAFTKLFSVYFFNLENMTEYTDVPESSAIELECLARGKPTPTVQWFKDGEKLNATKYEYRPNTYHIANAHLSIKNGQQVDGGNYTCQVDSGREIFNTSTTVRINVITPTDGPPWIDIAGIVIACICFVCVALGGIYFCYTKKIFSCSS